MIGISLSRLIGLIDGANWRTLRGSARRQRLEVSFSKEIESLRLGAGDTFHGEGILAITKDRKSVV